MVMNYAVLTMSVSYEVHGGFTVNGGLSVLITTLCPCSKDSSEYSAHNQRGQVSMDVQLSTDFNEDEYGWKEQLLAAADSNASSRLHSLLKCADERIVP